VKRSITRGMGSASAVMSGLAGHLPPCGQGPIVNSYAQNVA
jgi:hypothetical protein